MLKDAQAAAYVRKLQWWFTHLLLAWGGFSHWWSANRYAWSSAAASLVEASFILVAPLLAVFSPIFAYLELRKDRKKARGREQAALGSKPAGAAE